MSTITPRADPTRSVYWALKAMDVGSDLLTIPMVAILLCLMVPA